MERVSFTPTQQIHVDRLINEAYGKGRRKAQAEIDALKAEIEELKNKKLFGFLRRRFNSEVQHLGEQEGRCYPKWLCRKENMFTCLCLKET